MADITQPGVNPLTEDDLRRIQDSLAQLEIVDAQIQAAELAGIEVGEQKKRAADAKDRLLRVKQVYFPGR